jgi:hypothetical protein
MGDGGAAAAMEGIMETKVSEIGQIAITVGDVGKALPF